MFEIYQSVIKILWDEVFMNTNKLKLGQILSSTVIGKKRSAFEMQAHLMVVLIFLKTRWKILKIAQPIAWQKDLINMYRGALVHGL